MESKITLEELDKEIDSLKKDLNYITQILESMHKTMQMNALLNMANSNSKLATEKLKDYAFKTAMEMARTENALTDEKQQTR